MTFTSLRAVAPLPDMSKEQVFRESWLPMLVPDQDLSTTPLSLLFDLYRDVYHLGPYAAEWGSLLRAIEALTVRLADVSREGYDPEAPQAFVDDLDATFGYGSEIDVALDAFGYTKTDGYVALAYHPSGSAWARVIWEIEGVQAFRSRMVWMHDGDFKRHMRSTIMRLSTGCAAVAQVVLLRCLPVTPEGQVTRERVWALHDAFMARWGLPLLVRY